MLKLRRNLMALALLTLAGLSVAQADELRGTTEQAQAMVKKGLAFIKENGAEQAFAKFSDVSNKEFHDRDLYLFVYDLNGVNLSHGNNSKMQGKNLIDLKVGDKFIIKDMVAVVSSKGHGWVDYRWPNPVTKALELKSAYVEKHDHYFVGCGAYK